MIKNDIDVTGKSVTQNQTQEFLKKVVDAITAVQEIKQIIINNSTQITQNKVKQELLNKVTDAEEAIQEIKQELLKKNLSEESESDSNLLVIQKDDVDISELIKNLVSIFEYDGIIYMTESDIVRPFSNWAIKVNKLLDKTKLSIKGVIPHFYHIDNIFNYRLIFILSDDFYIWVNKEDVSDILDIKKDWDITFNTNIPDISDILLCDDLKSILEKMEKIETLIKNSRYLI